MNVKLHVRRYVIEPEYRTGYAPKANGNPQARRPKMNEIRKPTKASHEEALLVFDLIVADKTEPDR
jgi:hypothetical protein